MSYFIAMIKVCRVGVILIPTAQTRSEVVMKKYLTILCSLLVSSSISFAWASTAQQTTGQIYVRGAIVDPANVTKITKSLHQPSLFSLPRLNNHHQLYCLKIWGKLKSVGWMALKKMD